MKLLDLKNDRIVVSPEALAISFLGELWARDKSKDKAKAYKDIAYIYYMADFNSPYSVYPEAERGDYVKEYVVGKSFKEDESIKNAINEYKKLNTTPAMEMLEAANIAVHKMKEYFKTVDFSDGESTIDKVQRAIINMPKLAAALNEAKEICLKEKSSSNKNRAGYKSGLFED
jgi:hypothetical protein